MSVGIIIKGKHKGPEKHRIHYKTVGGNNYAESLPSKHDPKAPPRIVDPQGRSVKLTAYQKNQIYRKAKEMKRHISDNHCTKRECWDTNEHSVRKMKHEMSKPEKDIRRRYNKSMIAIGADPKDASVEGLRRRGRHNR